MVLYLLGQVLVHKGVFEVSVLYKMEDWPRLKDVKVFGYGQILIRRMAGVEEEEEEGGLDEELFADEPVVTVQVMERVKMMSSSWIMDVVRLFEEVELGLGC